MLDCGRFEVRVKIGSATSPGLSVHGYLGVNSLSSPPLEQETNSFSGDLSGRLPRLSRFLAQFFVQFLRQRDVEIPFHSSHIKDYRTKNATIY